jgi:uncharacterized protein (DUF362 family)
MTDLADLEKIVSVARTEPGYPSDSPYEPGEAYPEYPYGEAGIGGTANPVYRAVRDCLHGLGLDEGHFGTAGWNPLGDIIHPGQTVVLKPNFVIDRHYQDGDLYSIVTHPSVIRAVADFCQIALKGTGRLILADAPVDDCDFDNLRAVMGLDRLQTMYKERGALPLEVYDLRRFASVPGDRMYAFKRQTLAGDPAGHVIVDMGSKSALCGKTGPFFGADPSTSETQANHHGDIHRYCVSKTILSSDVLISIPKLKVHKKVGVTLNFKGFVGANTNKNFLVHYTMGTPKDGGDQTADAVTSADSAILKIRRMIHKVFFDSHNPVLERIHHVIFHSRPYLFLRQRLARMGVSSSKRAAETDGGNWYGNDSCWRMVVDLARILYFCDSEGVQHQEPQRRVISFLDGIVGGENNGPLLPDAKPGGIIVGGMNPLAVDLVACRLMGFDWRKLPMYRFLTGLPAPFDVNRGSGITVRSEDPELEDCLRKDGPFLAFKPHHNWIGHIEYEC